MTLLTAYGLRTNGACDMHGHWYPPIGEERSDSGCTDLIIKLSFRTTYIDNISTIINTCHKLYLFICIASCRDNQDSLNVFVCVTFSKLDIINLRVFAISLMNIW